MTFEVHSSLHHRPRAHSTEEVPCAKPVVMNSEEVRQLHLDFYGVSHAKDAEGDCFLVTHITSQDPDATPIDEVRSLSRNSSDSSDSSDLSVFNRDNERRVVRFHPRNFDCSPSCVVTIDELATLELVGRRSLRPDLQRWEFSVSPRPGKQFEICARVREQQGSSEL